MLKGAQKQMIVVRTRDSRLFEEAYFVMRRDADMGGAPTVDMIGEANRIIESARPSKRREKQGHGRHVWVLLAAFISFGAGLLIGGGGVGLLWLLL